MFPLPAALQATVKATSSGSGSKKYDVCKGVCEVLQVGTGGESRWRSLWFCSFSSRKPQVSAVRPDGRYRIVSYRVVTVVFQLTCVWSRARLLGEECPRGTRAVHVDVVFTLFRPHPS